MKKFAYATVRYHDYYAHLTQRDLSGPPLKDGLLMRAYVTHYPDMVSGRCRYCSCSDHLDAHTLAYLKQGYIEALDWLEQHSL